MNENTRINEHCHLGGLAAYIENDFIVIRKGNDKHYLAKVSTIPLTHHGIASCMIKNILPAVLAGIISHFTIEQIVNALHSFKPSPENIPGRMNLFHFANFQVLVDYAHNVGAFLDLKEFISKVSCKHKIGIIGATSNRRAEDIQQLGYHCAQIFDEIIIRHDEDGRGRTNQELTDLIMQGITSSNLHPKIKIISNEFEAVKFAMDNALPETLIFYSVDKVLDAVEYMKKEEQKYKSKQLINSKVFQYETKREVTDNRRS
jgi:cyanophycin synthetase